MRTISYFGVRRSGLSMKVSLNKVIDAPTAIEQGIVIPTSGKNGVTAPWGDVMVCVKEALAASPQMRADMKAMLEELDSAGPTS